MPVNITSPSNITALPTPEVTGIPIFQSYTDLALLVITAITAITAIITAYLFFYHRPKLAFSVIGFVTQADRDKGFVIAGGSLAKMYNIRVANTGRAPVENLSVKIRNPALPKDVFNYVTLDLANRMLARPTEIEQIPAKSSIDVLLPKEEYTFPFLLMIKEPMEVSCRFVDDMGRSGKYNMTGTSGNKLIVEMLPLGRGLNYRKPLVWELNLNFEQSKLQRISN